MRKINKKTGEIVPIKVEGLWSHFPIPACRLLAEKGEQKEDKGSIECA
jgi:hypothetical protein